MILIQQSQQNVLISDDHSFHFCLYSLRFVNAIALLYPLFLLMILVQNFMLINDNTIVSQNQQKRNYSPSKFSNSIKSAIFSVNSSPLYQKTWYLSVYRYGDLLTIHFYSNCFQSFNFFELFLFWHKEIFCWFPNF